MVDSLLTVEQLADRLHYSKDRIRVLARTGKIPGAYQRGRRWLFDFNVVERDFLKKPVFDNNGESSDNDILE